MSLSFINEYKEIHFNCIWCVRYNPVLDLFASCGEDANINIWEYNESEKKYKIISLLTKVHFKSVRCCDWDYTGKFLSACSFDHILSVWKITNNEQPYQFENILIINSPALEFKSVTWSVSGSYLAFCTRKGEIHIWEKETNQLEEDEFFCNSVIQEDENDFKCVKFSPREDVLFSCGFDSEIYVYNLDLELNEFVKTSKINNLHKGTIWYIEINKTGDLFFTCGEDGSIKGFKINFSLDDPYNNIVQIINYENAHKSPIYCCSLTFDEKYLLSCSTDGNINIYEIDEQKDKKIEIKLIQKNIGMHNKKEINFINCNKKKNQILSCGDDLSIKIWEININK